MPSCCPASASVAVPCAANQIPPAPGEQSRCCHVIRHRIMAPAFPLIAIPCISQQLSPGLCFRGAAAITAQHLTSAVLQQSQPSTSHLHRIARLVVVLCRQVHGGDGGQRLAAHCHHRPQVPQATLVAQAHQPGARHLAVIARQERERESASLAAFAWLSDSIWAPRMGGIGHSLVVKHVCVCAMSRC